MTPTNAYQFIKKWRPDSKIKQSGNWLIHSCIIDKVIPHHANGDINGSAEINIKTGVYICFVYMDKAISFKNLCKIMHDKCSFDSDIIVTDSALDELKQKLIQEDDAPFINISIYPRCTHPYMLKTRGFSQDVLDLAQIKYDNLSGRIAIPIFDKSGNCLAIQRRVIPGENLDGYVHPKYEWTKGFDKSKHLYHVGELDYDKPLLVVESVMSVLRAWDYGMHNCVATFGSHMSKYQASTIKRFQNVIMDYDGDEAGKDGTAAAISMLAGNNVLVIDMQGYGTKDIADIPKKTFIKLLKNAKPALEYILHL